VNVLDYMDPTNGEMMKNSHILAKKSKIPILVSFHIVPKCLHRAEIGTQESDNDFNTYATSR